MALPKRTIWTESRLGRHIGIVDSTGSIGGLTFCLALWLVACGRTDLDPQFTLDDPGSGTFSDTAAGSETSGAGEASSSGAEETTTGGPCEPYGNPGVEGEGCCEGDVPLELGGVPGSYCAPACAVDADCPLVEGEGLTIGCIFNGPSGSKEYCAALCNPDLPVEGCPFGSTCKALSSPGVGVCTHG